MSGASYIHSVQLWMVGVHGYFARYVKLRVAHAPGMPGTLSPLPRVSDPDMHHGTCVRHVPWCMPGSPTSSFLWKRWRGKRSRHSRCMRKPHLYISGVPYHNNSHRSYSLVLHYVKSYKKNWQFSRHSVRLSLQMIFLVEETSACHSLRSFKALVLLLDYIVLLLGLIGLLRCGPSIGFMPSWILVAILKRSKPFT